MQGVFVYKDNPRDSYAVAGIVLPRFHTLSAKIEQCLDDGHFGDEYNTPVYF